MAEGHGASTRTAHRAAIETGGVHIWSHEYLSTMEHIRASLSQQTSWLSYVSLVLPEFLQGPVASLAERCCPCPSLSAPRLCPGCKPVEIEALCPLSCLCPRASCRDRAVLLLSGNIPIWALIDFIDHQPCHQQLPASALFQPDPRTKLSQTPPCQTSDNILEPVSPLELQCPQPYLGGSFQGSTPSSCSI